jgi:outer membrane protein OmpA-like peptidoglycan-associated protein
MKLTRRRWHVILAAVFAAGLGLSSTAFADHFHGVIYQRGTDGTILVQTDDDANVRVVVSDRTKVKQSDSGRSRRVSAALLIPGLLIEVQGAYSDTNRFVADRVTFRKSDQRIARAIQGGLSSTELMTAANQQRIDQQGQALRQQRVTIQQHQQRIAAADEKIAATTGVVEANAERISNLDYYNVIASVTVYFDNGQSTVPAKYREALLDLVAHAKTLNAYVVQVQGYASAVGADTLNDRLSAERAESVARVLEQSGVPPTNLAPPAGMGSSQQVAPNKTAKEQAENRRAVVTLLQNNGVSVK